MTRHIAIAAAALSLASFAQAATYDIDPSHSTANFKVRHLMISNVKGDFSKVTGSVEFDQAKPAATRIDATIDATSVNTNEPKRDAHLKSPDFFDVAKYPALTFKSKSVTPAGAHKFNVQGDLTLHGVTKTVTLAVETTAEIKDPWGNTRFGANATTRINRKEFGLTWNQALEAGGVAVSEDVDITLDIELVKKAAPAGKK
jgi:polyisoprenoid-binding protein YceI